MNSINDDSVKKISYNIVIGDFSIGNDVEHLRRLSTGAKPSHLTDDQFERWKKTGNAILKNFKIDLIIH